MNGTRFEVVVGHVLAVLAGFVFLISGGSKLAGAADQVQSFAGWGFPGWFLYAVGGMEVLGAVLLVIPGSRIAGAALLLVVMVGAVATHTVYAEHDALLAPILLGGLVSISASLAFRRDS